MWADFQTSKDRKRNFRGENKKTKRKNTSGTGLYMERDWWLKLWLEAAHQLLNLFNPARPFISPLNPRLNVTTEDPQSCDGVLKISLEFTETTVGATWIRQIRLKKCRLDSDFSVGRNPTRYIF